jgi:hypothetical protein
MSSLSEGKRPHQEWWRRPVTPALGNLSQEEHKFRVSPDYKVSLKPAWAIEPDPVSTLPLFPCHPAKKKKREREKRPWLLSLLQSSGIFH